MTANAGRPTTTTNAVIPTTHTVALVSRRRIGVTEAVAVRAFHCEDAAGSRDGLLRALGPWTVTGWRAVADTNEADAQRHD